MKLFTRKEFIKTFGLASLAFSGLKGVEILLSSRRKHLYNGIPNKKMGVVSIPDKFSYLVISNEGDAMSDGLVVPGMFDGMATFKFDNSRIVIVRNHELYNRSKYLPCFGKKQELLKNLSKNIIYDSGTSVPEYGGTTNLLYNQLTSRVEKEFMSLSGTVRNCAGGVTPWGSWISCEESVVRRGNGNLKNHGYNFEVLAADKPFSSNSVPLKAMGRFNHEAVGFDLYGNAYQTEDREDGIFYKFIPKVRGDLSKGKLQGLALIDRNIKDSRNWKDQSIEVGRKYRTHWINIFDVDSIGDDLRYQGADKGCLVFARGEGIWSDGSKIYFSATTGGPEYLGQIWVLETKKNKESLTLVFQSSDRSIMKMPDNLTVSPWGDIVFCEDGPGTNYVKGLTPNGEIYDIVRNEHNSSEFCGVCFSPDGETMFVNIQRPGMTLAIKGPWPLI